MTEIKQKKTLWIVYAYLIEVFLAGLVYLLIWQQEWLSPVTIFLDGSASSWATLSTVLLTSALGARLVFFSLNSGDFAAWLEWKKVGGIYSGAVLYAGLLFLMMTVTMFVLIYVKGTWLTEWGVFIGILGLINAITFAFLVHRLTRLQAKFNFEYKKEGGANK
jgi:hypothetical protein